MLEPRQYFCSSVVGAGGVGADREGVAAGQAGAGARRSPGLPGGRPLLPLLSPRKGGWGGHGRGRYFHK